jgi:hypothetical protein
MIAATVEELTPLIGTRPACRALGASPATIYRRRRPPEPKPSRPQPTPARALSEPDRQQVLEVLHSERSVDVSPEETWATLLDEGTYLCSPRTMYRILAAKHGGVRERRDQLTHPSYAKPELIDASRPGQPREAGLPKRILMIEPVFAHTKHNRTITRFHRRGRIAVRTEWRLLMATHNLTKLHRHHLAAAGA